MRSKGPIFLAGVDRSGIGFLGELLESHPNIAISRRTNFWSFYYKRFGDLSQLNNLDICLNQMMRNSRIQRLKPQPDRLRRDFLQDEPSYPRLFALLEEQYMERLGKSRWGDKSLGSERYADIIMNAYPQAKMVHVIRDPRDRYASQYNHRGVGKGELGAGIALWLWSVRVAERNFQKYKGRYKIVQYEALVRDPETQLRMLCDFLDETYSPIMLSFHNGDDNVFEPDISTKLLAREIWTTSIGRFQTDLTTEEIAFIQLCTQKLMVRYGYQTSPIPLSRAAKLSFYLFYYPINLSRLLLWYPWSEVKEMLGKTPSARRLLNGS